MLVAEKGCCQRHLHSWCPAGCQQEPEGLSFPTFLERVELPITAPFLYRDRAPVHKKRTLDTE